MLTPLRQWVCDHCRGVIEEPGDGWLEFKRDEEGKAHSFRIVHHTTASPRAPGGNCYYPRSELGGDLSLENVVQGADPGIAYFLAWIDDRRPLLGDDRDWNPTVHVPDLIEIMRRLYIPYYEEARLYYEDELDLGGLRDMDCMQMTMPETTKRLVDEHGEGE